MAIAGPSALRRIRAPREIAFILSENAATIVPTDRNRPTRSQIGDD
jgi:hypothetical protein